MKNLSYIYPQKKFYFGYSQKNSSISDKISYLGVRSTIMSMFDNGKSSFRHNLFKTVKLVQMWISPVSSVTRTRLDIHLA